jgi:hypothetical protein
MISFEAKNQEDHLFPRNIKEASGLPRLLGKTCRIFFPPVESSCMRESARCISGTIPILFRRERVKAMVKTSHDQRKDAGRNGLQEWLSLKDAGKEAGISAAAVRMWIISRMTKGDYVEIRKEPGKYRETWYIHSSEMKALRETHAASLPGLQEACTQGDIVNLVSLDRYEAMRRDLEIERDRALQGLMMYRYKFEELDQKMKLLPAPADVVAAELERKDAKVRELEEDQKRKVAAIIKAQQILRKAQTTYEQYEASMAQLKARLQEEEQAKEALRAQWEHAQAELKKPWWQKLFAMKVVC